ncbi:metalloregulator ArsR/SmtB family transcription factor [Sphingomonas glaciei]|uniref:metalloregulator ArsR/SmtB family transcription factor n=1 Tax=Sphingomonas glaciei TaxID=2938948 RepID=UPI003873813C
MFATAPQRECDTRGVFYALSSAVRFEIVDLLSDRNMTLSELSAHFEISNPAVLHHLKILGEAEIISRRRSGGRLEYALVRRSVIAPIRNYVRYLGFVHQ